MLARLDAVFPVRYVAFALCCVGVLLGAAQWVLGGGVLLLVVSSVLVIVGVRDVTQDSSSILRNYPVIAHLRFLLEFISPEIRQYFIENDTEAMPFSRAQR